MASAEPSGPAAWASLPGPWPSGTGAAGPPSGRSGIGVPGLGQRTPAAVEKRGPYMVARAPSIQAKLQKHRDLAKAVLRRKGMLGAAPKRPDSSGKSCSSGFFSTGIHTGGKPCECKDYGKTFIFNSTSVQHQSDPTCVKNVARS
ncbi:protein FAM219B-like [Hippopotamus amphibius kiboko]|uniref:protein FAM219B-like n=1 Tax=Hippopotamus amphibius kiboko TaxID=575201 RepID=UPI0025922628|nr:protein FAM219B-like [Hippopotamus amphibius kiboko]